MAITATKKFNYLVDGQTRTFYPGTVVEDEGAAVWALDQGYAEERPEDPEPVEARAFKGAPNNKALSRRETKSKAKRAQSDDGTMVLGSEDEIEQDETEQDEK